RLVSEYPVIVAIGFAEEDVLAPYFARMRLMLAEGAALTLAGLLLAGFAGWVLSRERLARAAITRTEQRLRDAIDSIDAGFVLFEAGDRLVMCNEKYLELLPHLRGHPDIIGMSFEEIIRGAARALWFSANETEPDLETWVQQRISQHRNPPRDAIEMQV